METIQPQSRADRSSGVDQYSVMQGTAVYLCILQCSAGQCSAVLNVAVKFSSVMYSAVQCSGMESDSAIIPGQLDPL